MDRFRRFLPLLTGIFLAGLLFIFTHSILFSAILFVVAAFVTKVSLTPHEDPSAVMVADGVSRMDFDQTIRTARSHLQALQNEAFKVLDPKVRDEVNEIARLAEEIIKDVKDHPEDFRTARRFFAYYLEATVSVIRNYVKLSHSPMKDPGLEASLAKVEGELATIREAFGKQLRVLADNDVLDLDVELKVLKTSLEAEGLGRKTGGPNTGA